MEDHTGIRRTRSATSELVYRIRARIREQELLPGEKLGSERALADSLGVSRSDLRNALTVLESDHEIIRKIGRAGGIVISDGRLERNINTVYKDKTIYFGPMGCRTGFYMLLAGDYTSKDVVGLVTELFEFVRDFKGEVPGAAAKDCGNYLDMNLPMANYLGKRYLEQVLYNIKEDRLVYPE